MKQLKRRTLLILLPLLLLAGGLVLFGVKYLANGRQWAAFPANSHAYTGGRLTSGQILDRNGAVLYDAAAGEYHTDGTIRRATLHAVGDRDNNIATGVKCAMRDRLIGYDLLTGTTKGGHRLYLTIDSALNAAAYQALNGRKGTAAVYNYKTGKVLCMVSAPSFDPADPPVISDGDSRYEGVYLNRFLSAVYVPGSVFKVVTTAAALENLPGIEERTFTCTGSVTIGGDTITCPHVHGEMDLYDALAHSCNCVYAQLAVELGGDVLEEYAQKAGLLDRHEVSGISTAAGSFSTGEDSQLGWAGVGQYNDLVNPCAMLTLMGSIAAGRGAAQPRLIEKETTPQGLRLSSPGRTAAPVPWQADTCAVLRKMMRNDVTEIYGQSRFGDLAVCAKSGTAEVGGGQAPHSWFVGFIDDETQPLAFVVVVENGGSGSDAAGSVAAAVLREATRAS